MTPGPRLRPHGRQAQLQRRDATPRLGEVAGIQPFQGHRARGVVTGHQIEDALAQSLPQRFSVSGLPDGRCALEGGGPVGHLLGRECEVVGTRLGGYRESAAAGLGEQVGRLSRRYVDHVHGRARLRGEPDEGGNGLCLRLHRRLRRNAP